MSRLIVGVDEAGRGPLAGPVVAAAVILDPARLPRGLDDSKAMSAAAREAAFEAILSRALAVAIGFAPAQEIDRVNIRQATFAAMRRALGGLSLRPVHALIDGSDAPPGLPCAHETIVKGDAACLSIAAASIVAKVTRDRIMVDLAQQHPGYGWEANAGYPTAAHLEALRLLGVTPWHRRSFKPVHNILYQEVSVSS